MNVLHHTIWLAAMTFIAGTSLSSCVYESETGEDGSNHIRINTMVVNGSPVAPVSETETNRFAVLFWREDELTDLKSAGTTAFPAPYLIAEAPQSVEFYSQMAYDTRYPYPYPEKTPLYATGFAPVPALTSDDNFRTLTVDPAGPDKDKDKGRRDFLGCDLWPEVYKGSQSDPFAKSKNKLYFRHLAAKLKFYADRDRESMENKQYVRNVRIKNLRMRTDAGDDEEGWQPLHTPSVFKWSEIKGYTSSYLKTIDAIKAVEGNEEARDTRPGYGYHIYASEPFTDGFVFRRNARDRVPIRGMYIDSCYVCNPTTEGKVSISGPIRLRMDITALLSFHPDFPLTDVGDGSTTDDLTFTRTWKDVKLDADAIYPVDADGNADTSGEKITEFKPGSEYRVYIHFHRTGVNLTALEMPWNEGGVHYITISGGDRQPAQP